MFPLCMQTVRLLGIGLMQANACCCAKSITQDLEWGKVGWGKANGGDDAHLMCVRAATRGG